MDGGDKEIVTEEVVIIAFGEGTHQRFSSLVAFHDMGIHVGDQFCVQPGELADYLQFRRTALPKATFAVPSVEEQTAERRELGPADVDIRGDLIVRPGAEIAPLGWWRGG